MAKKIEGIMLPSGKLTGEALQRRLQIAHASGRLQPNDRARENAGRRRGGRQATRKRAIAAGW